MYLIFKVSFTFALIVVLVKTFCKCLNFEEQNDNSRLKNLQKIDKDDFKFNDILYLTPYIEDDRLEEAIADSEVKNLPGIGRQLKSYSGFLTVNKKFNSNLFFWFFPAMKKHAHAPVLLWLSAGTTDASVTGMFTLNGPIQVDENGNPSLRNYTWNREFSVLYIDNPVGTGFSFTDNDDGFARGSYDAAVDLYEGLRQFFTIFADYRQYALFLTGYSYACQYHADLANRILKMQNNKPKTRIKMNLQGVAIGGGFCDPRHQYDYADFLYQVGLIEDKDWTYFWLQQLDYLRLILQHKWAQANDVINDLYFGYYVGRPEGSYFRNISGYDSLASLLHTEDLPELNYYTQYLSRRDTKRAIHVGRRQFNSQADKVAKFLYADVAKSVKPQIETLLNANVRMLFYNGNHDMVSPVPLMENMLRNLQWNGLPKYLNAQNRIYRLDSVEDDDDDAEADTNSTVAGYVRQADNLQFVIVRNADRHAPLTQPKATLDVITRFVKRINLNSALTKI